MGEKISLRDHLQAEQRVCAQHLQFAAQFPRVVDFMARTQN
jgi:hypothetical protein